MKVTATDFRRNLFQLMDKVVNGELVEVVHKGNIIRLAPQSSHTKLSRLIERDTLLCTPDELEKARKDLQVEMREEMEKDWPQT